MNQPRDHLQNATGPTMREGSGDITINYRTSLQVYLAGRRLLYGHRLYLKMGFILLIGIVVCVIVSLKANEQGRVVDVHLAWFPIFIVFLVTIVGPLLDRWAARNWYLGDHGIQSETSLSWNREGLSLSNRYLAIVCAWPLVHALRHNRHVIAINGNNGFNAFIPYDPQVLYELERCRSTAARSVARGVQAQADRAPGADGVPVVSAQVTIPLKFSDPQLRLLHSPVQLLKTMVMCLAMFEGVILFDTYVKSAAAGFQFSFMLYAAMYWSVVTAVFLYFNRRAFRRGRAINGTLEFIHDDERFGIVSNGQCEYIPWSTLDKIRIRRGLIALLDSRKRSTVFLPNEEVFAEIVRNHRPDLWKLAASAS